MLDSCVSREERGVSSSARFLEYGPRGGRQLRPLQMQAARASAHPRRGRGLEMPLPH